MPVALKCPRCGATLPSEGWEGLCPKCIVRISIDTPADLRRDELRESSEQYDNPDSQNSSLRTQFRIRYFGDYQLLEEIARGGMGIVYKARQRSLNRIVAVKMILSGEHASPEFVQRFRAEAEAAANLSHANIVAIYEIGEHEGEQYFSMEYVEGENLAEWSAKCKTRNKEWCRGAAEVVATVAEAIDFAHEHGILHRDLKPSNVLIDKLDQPRITDFGLAKRLTNAELGMRSAELTVTGQVIGSPNYMPPEQAQGKHCQATIASDIYSLGAILYHLLTGRPPFASETVTDTLQKLLQTEPASPRISNTHVPRDLETICLKCLEKEPARRYGAAQELADELGRFLRDEPIRARPIGPTSKMWRLCRRKPGLAGLAIAAGLLLLAVAIGLPTAIYRIRWERKRAEQNANQAVRQRQVVEEANLRVWLSDVRGTLLAGKTEDAIAMLPAALERWPDSPALWEVKAATEEEIGQFEAASQSYARAIHLASEIGITNDLETAKRDLTRLLQRSAAPGLVGWWRGECETEDTVSGQRGSLMNGVMFENGKVGQAFSLDGIDDFIVIPDSPKVRITGALTITGWIKPNSLNAGDILTKWDGFRSRGISYGLGLAAGGKLRFAVAAVDGTFRSLDSHAGIVPVGVWSHVAGTFNPVNHFLMFYINGVEVLGSLQPGSDTVSAFSDSETPIRLGAFVNGLGEVASCFSGLIDEVKLYRRVLSPSEIELEFRASNASTH